MRTRYEPEALSTFGRCRHCGSLAAMHGQDGVCLTVEELRVWLAQHWRGIPMTACTICGAACAGTDLDDEACCLSCFAANLNGAALRPLAWLTRERDVHREERPLPRYVRELTLREEE